MSDQPPNRRASWQYLPPEIRLMILETLLRLPYKWSGGRRRRRNHRNSTYAAVSREWHLFFETYQFKALTLHQDDLEDFDRIVRGHRRMDVKFIWLRLELPEYGCNSCRRRESPNEVRVNERLFTNAVWNLFSILSSWGKEGDRGVGQIILQLSAHSPSDALHYCQELKSRINYTGTPYLSHKPKNILKVENSHGWVQGLQMGFLPGDAKLRVLGRPQGLGFDLRTSWVRRLGTLPKVTVVNRLLIARHFYRHFSVPRALEPIIQSLTQLQIFSYEPWRGVNVNSLSGQELRDSEHTYLLAVLQRHKHLRSISMFENFRPSLHGSIPREPCSALGHSLANASQNHNELYAAFNVDAKDFFYAFFPGADPRIRLSMSWDKMEYICLSAQMLSPSHYNELIQVAGAAALKMPKLRCMELWNSDMDESCIFGYRYSRKENIKHVSLRSTWNGQFSKQAISRWRKVADLTNHELGVKTNFLDANAVQDYTVVIQCLRLRRSLLTAFSLMQLIHHV
ncbi:hypothetical protein V8C42DRAFT_104380 [Trichoderma barbatum]